MSCRPWADFDVDAYLSEPTDARFADFRAHYPECPDCLRRVEAGKRFEDRVEAALGIEHLAPRELLAFERDPASLAAQRRGEIANHLEHCPRCRNTHRALGGFEAELLKAARAAPKTRPLDSWLEWLEGLFSMPRPALALGFAAAAALTLALWFSPLRSEAPQFAQEPDAPPATELRPSLPDSPPPSQLAARQRVQAPGEDPPAPPTPTLPEAPPAPGAPLPTNEGESRRIADSPAPAPAPFPAEMLIAFHDLGAPSYATPFDVAMGSRVREVLRGESVPPPPQVLAPDHAGRTLRASPTLHWSVAAPTPAPYLLTLLDPRSETSLLELDVEAAKPGIQAVDLAVHGVELEPGVVYRWYLSVPADLSGGGGLSGGAIERVEPADELRKELGGVTAAERTHVLARAGIWYDALAELSTWIDAHPDDAELRRQRAALLEQAGLDETASRERSSAR